MTDDEWRVQACGLLHDEYGSDDIAVMLGRPASDVRALVRTLRNAGELNDVLSGTSRFLIGGGHG